MKQENGSGPMPQRGEKGRRKTNVLLLLSDQQRYDTINAAGFPHMRTPNLDRLAREGVLFEQCHSTNPVCMACRHDLITGRGAGPWLLY